ncbi:DNA-binding domain-containing protein [Fodinibius salsisoli]|uniref:DUF4469 domain-containing protein n=1 Tax=Fodinibius salsisoli TaxID=2820877 RepID=A0ABT3PHU7_9BACT|nr:DNA-binding domain-containing protein [Fodinibius salsisoli]MCW9705498.1 DUF4469 domain-containing protein [Fodinibius salsisoli]
MSLKYALYPNYLTTDPNDYMAIVQDQESHEIEDIIDLMISRGSTVTKAEALSVIEEYEAAIEKVLEGGDSVNTSIMRVTGSMPGVFNDLTDRYDESRHYVRLNMNPGPRVKRAAQNIEVEKIEADRPEPALKLFEDVASDTTNETLTPGGVAKITGRLLKVDPEATDQGVFFIADDGTSTRSDTYIRNKPANLIVMIPESLPSGEYSVEVRTILQNTKSVRSGRLNSTVVVP